MYYLGYKITEAGEVINSKGLTLKGLTKKDGYKMYYLSGKWYYAHRIVGLLYIPNPLNKPEINHLDGNKLNNHVSNLAWCTHKENIIHSWANGRKRIKGVNHWLTGKKVSDKTKRLQSEAKKGIKHPKFKGFYIIHGISFNSSIEASKATGFNNRSIIRWCKSGVKGSSFQFQPI